jgi:UMP-CMP kinase
MAPTTPQPALPALDREKPLLAPGEVSIIFVLGGPGSGKGTQCAKLVHDFGFKHLSAGDLLRAEQDREGSRYGDMIRHIIKEGAIVPMEVTVKLLEDKILETINEPDGPRRFLIDGMYTLQLLPFTHTYTHIPAYIYATTTNIQQTYEPDTLIKIGFPRKMDQAIKFEQAVTPSLFTLFFDCPEATMQERLMQRGKTSGRADDNAESIKKRFKTFVETSMPVVEYFEQQGKVLKVSAVPAPDQVYDDVKRGFAERGVLPTGYETVPDFASATA